VRPELDELADLPPEEFVAARDALAKRLRAEGDAPAAAEARALRRPTVPQWVAGQVRRHHPKVVDDLRATSLAVAEAQEAAITRGERDGLREAGERRRQALAAVGRAVDLVLTETGRPAHHREEALRAIEASVTAEVTSGSFGLPDDVELPDPVPQEPAEAVDPELPEVQRRRAEAEAEAERRRAEAEAEAEVQRRRAEAAVEEAEARVRRARQDLAQAEAELEAAREHARRSQHQA
jgi:hypothetical protein